MAISILRLVLILAPMVVGLPFAMDIYVPALPHIASVFHVSPGKMQDTLTTFIFTAGIMQLLIGPLSDHYGRKSVGYFCIAFFTVGTILCAGATNLPQLTHYRMIQAIGSCGMLVIAFAIVRDVFHGTNSARAYSFLNGIISFSPMFAPFIGSYLDVRYGWPATFWSLLVISVAAWLTVGLALPETLAHEQREKIGLHLFQTYRLIFSNRIFAIYTVATATGLSYLYLFCSISSHIIITQLHIPELHYGYYFCFMGISFLIGSLLSGAIVGKLGIYKTVLVGFMVSFTGGIVMLSWFLIKGLTIENFIWPMLLIGIGGTLVLGAGGGGLMEPFEENIGAASALSGAFRFIFSALVGMVMIGHEVTTTLPLAIPAVVFNLIGLFVLLVDRKHLEFQNSG